MEGRASVRRRTAGFRGEELASKGPESQGRFLPFSRCFKDDVYQQSFEFLF